MRETKCRFRQSSFALVIVFTLLFAACSKKQAMEGYGGSPSPLADKSDEAAPTREEAPSATPRKIITTHGITVEVSGFDEAFRKLATLAEAHGGYTTAANRYSYDDGTPSGQIKMRVPSGKANAVLEEVRKLGKVKSEASTGEDITDQYVDLEARLKNARAAEARLLEIMHKATKVADVLAVENEITRVRGDIESMDARKRNWDLQTQTVAIEVNLQVPTGALPAYGKVWRPIKTAFREGVEGFAQSLHFVVVFIGAALPWLAAALLGYIIFTKLKKKRRKERADESS